MSPLKPSIARLRRHMALVARLCAFVVLAKAALVSVCLTDGFVMSDGAVVVLVEGATAIAAEQADTDPGSPCWHADSGGCHCTCAHSTIVPTTIWSSTAIASTGAPRPTRDGPPAPLPPIAELRPPIA